MNKTLLILFSIFFLSIIFVFQIYSQIVHDFKVNDDNTIYSNQVGKIDFDSLGNFVIVWQDKRFSTPETHNVTVFAQRYSFQGLPIGINFKVSDVIDTAQLPNISVKKNGNFTVCWIAGNKS